MWLKRSTPQNIVIGGAAGAFPPMIGWAAVTGSISLEPVLLFLIIFFWTPPHFWALALLRVDEYARAGVPMLPVVAGVTRDPAADRDLFGRAACAVWRLGCMGYAGPMYGVTALVAGIAMLALSSAGLARGRRRPGSAGGAAAVRLLDPLSLCPLRRAAGRSRCPDRGRKVRSWTRTSPMNLASFSPTRRSAAGGDVRSPSRSPLGVLVVLFYVVTLVKGPGGAQPADVNEYERTEPHRAERRGDGRNLAVALACGVLVGAMIGGGLCGGAALRLVLPHDRLRRHTAGRARALPAQVLARKMTVRFDANVAAGLPWSFEPEINAIEVAGRRSR